MNCEQHYNLKYPHTLHKVIWLLRLVWSLAALLFKEEWTIGGGEGLRDRRR